MANIVITSYFSNSGTPATGLTPTIKIWEIDETTNTLVVNGDSVTEVGDGFYKYVFNSYDNNKNYNIITDGGTGLSGNDRYSIGSSETNIDEADLTNIENAVWNSVLLAHLLPGTFGEAFNQDHADIQQLRIDVTTVLDIVNTILDYNENRTLIDVSTKELVIFQDDGITELRRFKLKDSTGTPSLIEVAERDPIP